MSLKGTPQHLPVFHMPDYYRPIACRSGYESPIRGYRNRLNVPQVFGISFEGDTLHVSLVDAPPRDTRTIACNDIAVFEGDCGTE
jgi:hypothetical protein